LSLIQTIRGASGRYASHPVLCLLVAGKDTPPYREGMITQISPPAREGQGEAVKINKKPDPVSGARFTKYRY